MTRFVSFALPAAVLLITACGGATFRWRPSLASHVPDGTPVRFAPQVRAPHVAGRALDWQRGAPKVITARGDTVVIPDTARLEVRLREKKSRATPGAVIGWAVGVGISYAYCPPPKTNCGEQDPTPILAAGLGALIGSRFKADDWVKVRWDAR